jgi:NitT/TauT family transport system substrate-binding protein
MRQGMVIAVALALGIGSGSAAAEQQVVRFAHLEDPSRDAILWAINQGIVTSDTIRIEARGMDVPALIQTMPTREFDVVETSSMAVPSAVQRGLDLTIIGTGLRVREPLGGNNIWVKADSDIVDAAGLKGKTIGVYAIRSTATTMLRVAFEEYLGLDVEADGIELVEIPLPALPSALAADRVDGATLIHAQAYRAQESGEFRVVAHASDVVREHVGVVVPQSMLTGYVQKVSQNPDIYREFIRMINESRDYALANRDEVFGKIGEESGMSRAYFDYWFDELNEFPVTIGSGDIEALDYLWRKSEEYGILDAYIEPADVIWAEAPRAE